VNFPIGNRSKARANVPGSFHWHRPMRILCSVLLLGIVASAPSASAHGTEGHATASGAVRKEQKPWGIAGEAKAAKRTVEIRMTDSMRFGPDRLEVRQGETVRFRIHNAGRVMHEFVIGTAEELAEHAALMKKFPNMEHDEPYMAHVAPGKTGEIVWTFNRTGEFDFACLLPGHYDAGMAGRIRVVAR
jgi:uncharacterized cupredoxin-like copper-binding protein